MLADGLLHAVRVAACGDDGVVGGERGLGDVDAHPATCAGDEPNLLVSHLVLSFPFVLSRALTGAGAP